MGDIWVAQRVQRKAHIRNGAVVGAFSPVAGPLVTPRDPAGTFDRQPVALHNGAKAAPGSAADCAGKEMLPSVSRVAVLSDSLTTDQFKMLEAVNGSVGLQLQPLDLENSSYEFENAFRVALRSRAEAIFVLESASTYPASTITPSILKT